ncbi:DHHA1 domain-containing protein, partial [Arsukibacterium sp.]|uniref:alanine--tRNA ligase-related protein n=1 Tax=Arsukibacterium sp. TaxID=1977258 RepID=UPI00299EEE29
GFEAAMSAQRKRAQQASNFGTDYNATLSSHQHTAFTGYEHDFGDATVVEIFSDGKTVDKLTAGASGLVVLDETPFYAESGGQIGDSGKLLLARGGEFTVSDTVKLGKAFAHQGTATAELCVGDKVAARIDSERRAAIKQNHSATHLLHAALRQILGEHVTQKGSLVGPERLRFDFSHFEAVTPAELRNIELLVNQQIQLNHPLQTRLMPVEQAKAAGAMALFGEKYDEEVRVLSMGDFSIELCGGTHVSRTGDIGLFKIVTEAGIASGVRRIEAVSGNGAVQYIQQLEQQAAQAAGLLRGDVFSLTEKVQQALDKSRGQEKELEQLKAKLASQAGSSLESKVQQLAGVNVLISEVEQADPKSLRTMLDELKNKLSPAVILLATVNDAKVSLIAGVSSELTARVHAGQLVAWAAQQLGGKGGGRPDMAQAGGTDVSALPAVLSSAQQHISEKLNS